jgi:hypothetical protein
MGMAMYICFYAIEQTWLGSDDPKYPFDQDELDRFGIPQKFEAARRHRERRKPA